MLKKLGIALLVYVGIVVAFESMIGFFQPEAGTTLVITTTNDEGVQNDRVLARLETGGQIYVAANHWPRAWYTQALAHPEVRAAFDRENGARQSGNYTAVPVSEAEHARVHAEHNPGLGFRIVTGFPPRYFLRLDPIPGS
ncbi:MAG: hypothetical protein AB8G23_20590 [Myxococcota bacterium]